MTEAAPQTRFRIFISAPDDVAAERAQAARVFDDIAREFGGRIVFEICGGDPQREADRPSACDLVVCLLWKGLGTTMPPSYDRPDGTPRTGVEFEFEDALDSALRRETPDILVYKKRVLIDAEQAEAAAAELRALNAFWQKWFRNEQGHFTASFDGFETPDEFAEKLRRHVRQWLLRRRQDVTWPIELKGSPFRSLEPFEAEHAGVFFGRRRAIRQVVAKLAAAAARGCPFLVVLGASGSGKSSLARAGVIPWLTEHGVVPDLAEWRTAILRPASLGDDPLLGLATLLFGKGALPELASGDYPTPERFAGLAARSPEAAAILVSGMLRALHPSRETRLVLLLDQLEELLSRTPETRDALVAFVDALARGGRVWVLATLRSDRYPEIQACPGLLRLQEDGEAFDLLPPDQGEIRDIIEGPARAAGLSLEDSGERSLTALLEAAAHQRGALPLLQFTLHRLFLERDLGSGALLLSVYDRLGGLAGAIAGEAERTVAALPEPLQAALPRLLINLVSVEDGSEAASARPLRRADIVNPDVRALADRLVEGRFLVLEGSGDGATLRLAHEALLTRWPVLADFVRDERAFLAARSRLASDAANWAARERHPDFLLPSGRRLAEAAEALAAHRGDLDAGTIAFIEASLAAERQRIAEREAAERRALEARAEAAEERERAARRIVGRTRIAIAVVTVLLVAMVAAGVLWFNERQLAETREAEAQKAYATALKAASEGVTTVAQARASGQLANDVATQLIDATRGTFDRLGGGDQPVEVMAARAELYNQSALAAYLSGKFDAAADDIHKELAIANDLARREPDSDKWQWTLIRSHESLGQWSEQAGDLAGADAQYREMKSIADRMVTKLPGSPVWLNWTAVAVSHQADADRARGKLADAISGFRTALARFIAATQAKSATQFDDYLVNATRLALARALMEHGDVAGAIELRRAALERFKDLGDKNKSNHNWRFYTALASSELGDSLRVKGDLQSAYDAFQNSIAIQLSLSNADQSNYLLRNDFAAAGRGKADVFLDEGQTDKALKLYKLVLKSITDLAENDPSNRFWQRNFGQMHGRVGDAEVDAGDPAAAEQDFRESLATAEKLAALDASNADWQRELGLAQLRMGDLLHAKGDEPGAEAEYRKRLEIATRLAALDPANVTWQRDLIAAHGRLGQVLAARGDAAGAREEFKACAALPKPELDTDVVYNRHEDMHPLCEQQIGAAK